MLVVLVVSVVIEGGGVLCFLIVVIKWWIVLFGDLYVDICGEMEGGYVEIVFEIVVCIVVV